MTLIFFSSCPARAISFCCFVLFLSRLLRADCTALGGICWTETGSRETGAGALWRFRELYRDAARDAARESSLVYTPTIHKKRRRAL